MAGRRSRVEGLDQALAMLDGLPDVAREEMGVEMAILGREILAVQKADVPKDKGDLAAALSLRLMIDRLKVRVGLHRRSKQSYSFNRGRRRATGIPFYGRIVEFGRKAQTVLVTRRIKRRSARGNNKNGNRRRNVYEGKPYKMRVKAMAGRPYVAQPMLQDAAELHFADYWAKVLARTGGGA